MQSGFKRYLPKRRATRYLIAGGLSYAIELLVIVMLSRALDLSDTISVALAFWLGLILSFILQKIYAFESKTDRTKTTSQVVMYIGLVILNYAFTLLLVHLLQPFVDVTISRTIALAITTLWNFALYKYLIFK